MGKERGYYNLNNLTKCQIYSVVSEGFVSIPMVRRKKNCSEACMNTCTIQNVG